MKKMSDSLTLTLTMMDNLDKVIEIFNLISKNRFLDNLIPWRYEPDELNIPFWLQVNSLNTICE